MSWLSVSDALWRARWWMVPVAVAVYLIPILRLASFPFDCGGRLFTRINRRFGQWEHIVRPFRDTIATVFLAGGFFWNVAQGIIVRDWKRFLTALSFAALIVLSRVFRIWMRTAHLKLVEFAARFPTIHPQEFFDNFLCCSGAVRHILPNEPFSTIDPANIEFRSRRKTGYVNAFSLARGVWSTIWIARLALMTGRLRGKKFMQDAASSLAAIWGSRLCQLACAAVTIEDGDRLPAPGGFHIYAFTHMSFLDFALAPLVLCARRKSERAKGPYNNLPRFLLARDHFRDNFFYYSVLGIGKTAEELGMVFVDRRGGKGGADAIDESSAKLLNEGTELAIYPQGTRAARCVGSEGERLDSAYYTVGSRDRIRADGAHLKKGAAHIAVQAAMRLAQMGKENPVEIVPVAVSGTGIACPRGTMRILSGVHMRLRVGEPIVLLSSDVGEINSGEEPAFETEVYKRVVGGVHGRIDSALRTLAHVHAELERRFFEDMRGMIDAMKIEEIAIAMKSWRGDDYLIHAILDAIYACEPKFWRPFLNELIQHILDFATREELLVFKGRVADAVSI